MTDLNGTTIAFLARRGVEESELIEPWAAVTDAGGVPVLISDAPGTITALIHDWDRGGDYEVDQVLGEADPSEFGGLVLPGGTLSSDKLRENKDAQAFVRSFFDRDLPVAVVCHGGWILTEIGVLPGRTMTSVPRLATDLRNAGASWVDEEVHVDRNLVSSRRPADLPAMNVAFLDALVR